MLPFNTVQETRCLLSSHDVLLSCIQYSHSASHTIRYTYMHLRSIDSIHDLTWTETKSMQHLWPWTWRAISVFLMKCSICIQTVITCSTLINAREGSQMHCVNTVPSLANLFIKKKKPDLFIAYCKEQGNNLLFSLLVDLYEQCYN